VEQLLVERDLERSEFARMAARVDEVNIQNSHSTRYVAKAKPKLFFRNVTNELLKVGTL